MTNLVNDQIDGSIYIHVPFCKQACHYCDFYFSTNTINLENIVKCLIKELSLRKKYLPYNAIIESIYFGGGTPSILKAEHIYNIISTIIKLYNVKTNLEVTLEANPDDINILKLKELKNIGINRLSIGIQSFNNSNLKYLNRSHNKDASIKSILIAKQTGFNNINIDLIYSIPISNIKTWLYDLNTAISLKPEHISAYSLTIEKGTFFSTMQNKGKLIPTSEDKSAEQFELLIKMLSEHEYEHYEISNFCLPNKYSIHNKNYWQQKPYLGIGPSAHSYNITSRQYNVANNKTYITSIEKNIVPFVKEELTTKQIINEYIMTGLRTKWGISVYKLKEFNYDLLSIKKHTLQYMANNELIDLINNKITLTTKGKLVADKVIEELFID